MKKKLINKKHLHIFKQVNGFLDASILQCINCSMTLMWNISNQQYEEVK